MRRMLKKIYGELVLIRKELQAIKNAMELLKRRPDNSNEELIGFVELLNRMIENTKKTINQFEFPLSLIIESKRATEILKELSAESEGDDDIFSTAF